MNLDRFFDIPSDLQHDWLGLIVLHLREALLPVLGGLLLALPLAQLCVRLRWLYPPVLWVTTVLYAIPSLAFFVVLIDYTGQTELTVMIPLTVYSLVVLVPAIVDGVRSVPQETLAAATAMGFGPVRRYVQVQLPIAVPAIIAGLRVATVSSISLVSVGMLIGNQGALGNLLARRADLQPAGARLELRDHQCRPGGARGRGAGRPARRAHPLDAGRPRGAKSKPAGVRPESAVPALEDAAR